MNFLSTVSIAAVLLHFLRIAFFGHSLQLRIHLASIRVLCTHVKCYKQVFTIKQVQTTNSYRSQQSAKKQNVWLRVVSRVIFPAFAHREVLSPFVLREHPAFRNAHKYFSGKHYMAKFILCIVVLLGVQYFVGLKSSASVGLQRALRVSVMQMQKGSSSRFLQICRPFLSFGVWTVSCLLYYTKLRLTILAATMQSLNSTLRQPVPNFPLSQTQWKQNHNQRCH